MAKCVDLMATWSWQLTDSGFNPVGELTNIKEPKLSIPLGKVNTASFTIRLDNPLMNYLNDTSAYLKVYRKVSGGTNNLLFTGPIQTIQEASSGDTASCQVNAAGAGWIMTKRLTGKNPNGEGIKFASGTSRAKRFVELLTKCNEEAETHIDYETGPIECTSTNGYESTPFRYLSEVLNDLSNTAEGFDWRIIPLENYEAGAVTSQKIGRLITKDKIGEAKPDAAFEWGTGRNNVSSFTRIIDKTTTINKDFHLLSSGVAELPVEGKLEETSKGISLAESQSKYNLLEEVISASILSKELREKLVNANLEVRKQPRQTIAFEPVPDDGTGRVPTYKTDYDIGDTIPIRIMLNEEERLKAEVRVWGVEFAFDENKKETTSLTLTIE
jgi:hypothetical protein